MAEKLVKDSQCLVNDLANDCISRQAAIEALSRCQTYLFDARDTDRKISLEDAEYVIEKSPSAQPERKRGKWIIHETETDRYDDMKCPFCKKSYTVDAYRIDDIGFTAADFNFCPNCGADMRGEQG